MVSVGVWEDRFSSFLTGRNAPNTKKGGTERLAWCPVHQWDSEDRRTASAHLNFERNVWSCKSQGCHKGMSTIDSLWMDVKESFSEEKKESKNNVRKVDPLPSLSQLDRWHEDLMANETVLQEFKDKRGLSDTCLQQFRIGWIPKEKRYSIPVFRSKELVDVRKYRLNAREVGNKMISVSGHGGSHLFNDECLSTDEIILTEGELDSLTLIDRGFNAMAYTSGALAWQDKWSPLFEGKTVFVCFDDDDDGRKGALKTAKSLQRAHAKVFIISLRLPTLKKGDITDFFVKQRATTEDFSELIEQARESTIGQPAKLRVTAGVKREISVQDSLSEESKGANLTMVATVQGKASSNYLIPKDVVYSCGMDWGDRCNKCPMSELNGSRHLTIEPYDEIILSMIESSEEQTNKKMLREAGIPTTCPKVEWDDTSAYTVEEIMVAPSVEHRTEEISGTVERMLYNVGSHKINLNKNYEFNGTAMPSPKDRKNVFMAWDHRPVEVDIDKFEMTSEIYEQLQVFQPDEWQDQTPWDKLKEIAYDMSINVTRIYGRPELHIAYDLVWHSINSFKFGKVNLKHGWLECLVLGDTRTGKSEAAITLADHYQSGVVSGSDNASLAGLIGGSTQQGSTKSWGIKWGIIPLNDKRLVILDEAGEIRPEIIKAMSNVRSSGIAEVVKMGASKTNARTRLIWIANPVDGRTVAAMDGAINGVKDFVKNPEDVARFDFALTAASEDVPPDMKDQERKVRVPHIHNSDDCKKLVTWAWSRKSDDVVWLDGSDEYVYARAKEISARYIPDPQLIQQQNFDVKLARLSVAVAARLFSTDETGEKVLIGHKHVDTAIRFLDVIYGMPSFGYREHSRREIAKTNFATRQRNSAYEWLLDNEKVLSTLINVKNARTFKNRDFEESGGMMRDEAQQAVRELVDMAMLTNVGKGNWQMTVPLKEVINKLESKLMVENYGYKVEE